MEWTRRRWVTAPGLLLVSCGLALAWGACSAAPKNVTLSMATGPDGEVLDRVTHVVLVARKAGRRPLVRGAAGPGEVAGGHNFPAGTTGPGIAAYYRGLLANAGWRKGEDFVVDGATLMLLGVEEVSVSREPGPKYPNDSE